MDDEKSTLMERRWYFYREASGGWRWDVVASDGTVLAQSAATFASRAQSVQDAKAHGQDASVTTA